MNNSRRMKGAFRWLVASAIVLPVSGWIASQFLIIPATVAMATGCAWTAANMAIGYAFE